MDEKRLKILEKRVQNLEIALFGYFSLTQNLLPLNTQRSVGAMINDFFNASRSLGGFNNIDSLDENENPFSGVDEKVAKH